MKQLIKVKYIKNYEAKLQLIEIINDLETIILETNAYVGLNGVTDKKREGDSKTPLGLFNLTRGFGISILDDIKIDYITLKGNEFWIDDILSNDYNKLVYDNIHYSAEHLIKENIAYKYAVIIEYNTNPIIKGNGSAIFLHIKKENGTKGCVAVSEEDMIYILKWLDPNYQPKILIEE